MRIIGVIDLLGGRAVHATGGCRHGYRPVAAAAGMPVHGDPAALARVYAEQLEVHELYVADLDAIEGGAEQDETVRGIAGIGRPVWLDAGVSTVSQARRAVARGASRVVVGLETLPSFAALHDIIESAGPAQTAFSLDLRDARPIAADAALRLLSVDDITRAAVDAGVAAMVVLDLARVGSGRGLDVRVLETVRRAAPRVLLLAGGGVRREEDLCLAASAGCDGVLVATALHASGGAALVRSAAALPRGHGNVTR